MFSPQKSGVLIVGFGEMGRAIGNILLESNFDFKAWDSDAQKVPQKKEESFERLVSEADFIFLCIPSFAVRGLLASVIKFLKKEAIILSFAKGIEVESFKTMDQILAEFLPENKFALLSGPMIAEEFEEGLSGSGILASKNKQIFDKISKFLANGRIKIKHSFDVRGVALCGALKNIYAVGLGIADGLGLKMNVRGEIVVLAINEMIYLVKILGGKKETVFSVAGLGDLVTTGFSFNSRNHEVGFRLGKKRITDMESEGTRSLAPLLETIKAQKITPPKLISIIDEIVKNPQKAHKLVTSNW